MPDPSTATIGDLSIRMPALDHPDLLAAPVAAALGAWPESGSVGIVEIDPDLADTAALIAAHGVPAEVSANCVVVAGRREGVERIAACVVLATTRADVNGYVRRALDVRKASFLSTDEAVSRTSMEYGGITPIGLPSGWRILVDARVAEVPMAMIGSGVRRSKLVLPGRLLAALPGAEVADGLAQPVG